MTSPESSATRAPLPSREEPTAPAAGSPAVRAGDDQAVQPAPVVVSEERPFGKPGRPFDRRSPFFVGMTAAAGVAVTYGLILLLTASRDVLILIGLAMFLAIGLDPAATWLTRHGLPRWVGVLIIIVLTLGLIGGFLALAIPVLVSQGAQFAGDLPGYLQQATSHNSVIGQLNERFNLEESLKQLSTGERGISLVGGLLGAGKVVLGAAASTLIVLALTVYFLADMPRLKASVYRCVPQSRRARVTLIGDDILSKVGMFVLGNLLTSLVAGVATFIWLEIFQVPYALLLALFVALMDLVPVVGSSVAGIAIVLVALTVSLPIGLATVGFVLVYRIFEDYVLVPRIMGKAVEVPSVITLIAVTIGATLLGIIGALIAIPVAAALRLVLREVAFPRLDRS